MATYRAPGVFIEEISSGSRPILPAGTSTAAFIGTARQGPVNQATLVTSLAAFESTFGAPYRVTGSSKHYLAYAVRHFFEQGGSRCYVVRVAHYNDVNVAGSLQATAAAQGFDGTAPDGTAVSPALSVRAISPGVWGRDLSVRVVPSIRFSLRLGGDVAAGAATQMSLALNEDVRVGSLLWLVEEVKGTIKAITNTGAITFDGPLTTAGPPSAPFAGTVANDLGVFGPGLSYLGKTALAAPITVAAGVPAPVDGIVVAPTTKVDGTGLKPGDTVTIALTQARLVVERVSLQAGTPSTTIVHFASQSLPAFPRNRSRVYGRAFTLEVSRAGEALETHENLSLVNGDLADHVDTRLGANARSSRLVVAKDLSGSNDLTFVNLSSQALAGGGDGLSGLADSDFIGSELLKTGLNALTPVRDAAILAIPNASEPVVKTAIAYCERRGDLFLIIERPPGVQGEVEGFRSRLSSKYAAIYHPWLEVPDPFSPQPLLVPPCGAVAGIYALTDARRGVHKAPAGLDTGKVVVASGLERRYTKGEYDVLYEEEINLILSLRDGFHVWGSRTISPDAEWLQVGVRRLFNFLERSIENGTQWATFEPNDPTLWKSIERNVSAFLRVQWLEGKLVGATEKQAFFVHCNAETNPPEVVDAGQVVTVIGAAPSRPAEFVIFRIRQKVGQTAS